jgi:hypothetical protein
MSASTTRYEPARSAFDIAVLCLALALPSAVAFGLDTRTIYDVNIWSKPLKFQLSFALHWFTVAWLLRLLGPEAASARSLRWWLRIGAFASVVEVFYITLQAARGRASHFNFATPLETVLYYGLMGGAAVLMMLATIWVGWMVWRHAAPKHRRTGLWLGAVLGLVAGSIVTLFVTAPLAAGAIAGPGHWVGGLRTDATGLPVFGWSTTGGDLRVPHFFATHLLQALPLVGWIADRSRRSEPRRWVWGALTFGVVAVLATGWQALQGQPFWSN